MYVDLKIDVVRVALYELFAMNKLTILRNACVVRLV